jgi:Predicted transcriptional regulators
MSPARKEPDASTYAGRFAIRLRTLREKAGLTPEEAAEKIGVSAKSIYNWESGIREMSQNYYPVAAEALGLKSIRALIPEK